MKKIGLTGNIAAGKSTVEKIIKNLGYKVVDADLICHELMDNSEVVVEQIKEAFDGYDIFDDDGRLSRIKIGKIVFSYPKYKEILENIIHPFVYSKILEFFETNSAESFVFASVPLLFEAGMEKVFDKIIFVSADENIRLERLMKRNNFSKNEAMARISAQNAENDKILKSDFVIYNNGNIDELAANLELILQKFKKL